MESNFGQLQRQPRQQQKDQYRGEVEEEGPPAYQKGRYEVINPNPTS